MSLKKKTLLPWGTGLLACPSPYDIHLHRVHSASAFLRLVGLLVSRAGLEPRPTAVLPSRRCNVVIIIFRGPKKTAEEPV